jgi:hypothetical protein
MESTTLSANFFLMRRKREILISNFFKRVLIERWYSVVGAALATKPSRMNALLQLFQIFLADECLEFKIHLM